MRADVPSYELYRPTSLADALAKCGEGFRPFAGGTDLMVLFEAGKLEPRRFVSLWGLSELQSIAVSDSHVDLGALCTYAQIRAHALLASEFPNLPAAARETGAIAIQNRGTIGGSIANASPAADTPPALLCYDAELELVSPRGRRVVPYERFHLGYKRTELAPDELIARVRLPRGKKRAHFYRKVGTRKAQAISKVCMSGCARLEGLVMHDVRLGFGSMAPVPLRPARAEAALEGRALDDAAIAAARVALGQDLTAIDDIRSTRDYRMTVAGNVLAQFLELLRGAARR